MLPGDLLVETLVLVVLLLLSAFFSGSETAFFSLNSLEKDLLRRRSSGATGRFVHLLFSQPDDVLVTILTGNMFVNIFASAIAEAVGAEIFGDAAELLSIASMTLILLIVGEMTPKNLAIRHSLRFSEFSTTPMRVAHAIFLPLVYPLGKLRNGVLAAFPKRGRDAGEDQASTVLSAIRMGYQSKTIDESELRLLERFFRFRQKTAADVMIPRVDLDPVDAALTVSQFLSRAAESPSNSGSSLIPLYRENVDHISGYVRRVDLIASRFSTEDRRMHELGSNIHAVPASKDLRELMEEMSELGTEMSVVVDEYGGTEGVVSYPALVEYLFEDFLPEHERDIEQVDDGSYRIAGQVHVEEVAATLGIDLESDSRTIAGLIVDHFGEFPEEGTELQLGPFVFRVARVHNRRIKWIDVVRAEK